MSPSLSALYSLNDSRMVMVNDSNTTSSRAACPRGRQSTNLRCNRCKYGSCCSRSLGDKVLIFDSFPVDSVSVCQATAENTSRVSSRYFPYARTHSEKSNRPSMFAVSKKLSTAKTRPPRPRVSSPPTRSISSMNAPASVSRIRR